mgnify:CR=1 FL=1
MNWEQFNQYSIFFCAALAVLLIVLIIITVKFNTRLRTAERRYQTLTRGLDGADWHDLMLELGDDIAALKETTQTHEKFLHNLDRSIFATARLSTTTHSSISSAN